MSTSSKTQQVTLKVLEEFQQTDFKNEIVPIDADNYETSFNVRDFRECSCVAAA